MLPVRLPALLVACAALAACETDTRRFAGPAGSGVYQINANVFEVVAPSIKGAPLYWCGAAEYARRALGAPWNATISISRGLGPSEATDKVSAVQFTLNPGALGIAEIRSSTPNSLPVGDTKTITDANLYCDKFRFRQV